MSTRRVVVTGLGPVSPIGSGPSEFWNSLLEGRNGVRRIQSFDPSRFDSQIAGEIDGIKVADCVPKPYRKQKKIMARDIEIAVVAAYQAVHDAGLMTRCLVERGEAGQVNLDSTRFGTNIGAGLICADLAELAEALSTAVEDDDFRIVKWGAEGMHHLTPLWLLKFLPNMLACHVSIVHDTQGPSNTITCGEASSHLAIGEAFRTIQRGTADVCICGGAESKANPMALLRQSLGKRLSLNNDQPEKACRPFAADRDGTVISEGGGLVILEELEHARARGARIYCELSGFGASADAHPPQQPSAPAPTGRGLALASRKALRDAGVQPGDVDLITTFACGTREHDAAEAAGLQTAFGSDLADIPALSIKGGMGVNGAGSGALDFIAGVLALQHNTVPHAINSADLDPQAGLRLVTGKPIDQRIEVAISNGYALGGGQNASLVIKRYQDE